MRVEAAGERGKDGTEDEYLDPASHDIHSQRSRGRFMCAERPQGPTEARIDDSERQQE